MQSMLTEFIERHSDTLKQETDVYNLIKKDLDDLAAGEEKESIVLEPTSV